MEGPVQRSDDELLAASVAEPAAFAEFYDRHARALVGYFMARTRNAELAADLTAETFAAALAARARYRRTAGEPSAWLFGIATKKLADAQRRGYAEQRARRRMGMERIELEDADVARIEALAEQPRATALVEQLAADERDAVRARVIEDRSYAEIASSLHVSEVVVRKRVSRGLATVRERMGIRR